MWLYSIFAFFDNAVYSMVQFAVKLIMLIANYEFFKEGTIGEIAHKVYIVLGILVLFKMVISAIQYMINPDVFDDKDKGIGGLLKKIVIAMLLLVLIEPIFNFAMSMQKSIVVAIPEIVLDSNENYKTSDGTINELDAIGKQIAGTTIMAFVTPKNDTEHQLKEEDKMDGTLESFNAHITSGCDGSVIPLKGFDVNLCNYNYIFGISTAAGLFLLYVMLIMALDVGIRAIKLGILQIFAPIPISSYIVSKDKLTKFARLAMNVYIDLFVRLGIVYFIIFFMKKVITEMNGTVNIGSYVATDVETGFVKVAIIIALLMFAKNAPKFICDVLGVNSDNGDFKDMFKPQRLAGLAGAAVNPLSNAVSNYRKAMANNVDMAGPNGEKGRQRINALRRAIGGAGRGAFDAAAGIASGDDWSKIRQRHDKAVATSNRRSAENYMKRTSKVDAANRTQEIDNRREELVRYLAGEGIQIGDMLESSSTAAMNNYQRHTRGLRDERDRLNRELYSKKDLVTGKDLSNDELDQRRNRLHEVDAEYNYLTTKEGQESWIATEKERIAANRMASEQMVETGKQVNKNKSEMAALRMEISSGRDATGKILSQDEIAQRRARVVELETQTDALDKSINTQEGRNKIMENVQNTIANYKSKQEELRKIEKEHYVFDDAGEVISIKAEKPEISTGSIISGKVDKFFGGEGFTGKGYLDTADLLKNNRSSLYTGEAMTKMRQNADVLVDSSGNPAEFTAKFTNKPGVKITYADMADLKRKADNGTISKAELDKYGFANSAMIQSAFEDIEKQAAEAYVTANMAAVDPSIKTSIVLKPGVEANSTIVQGIKRMVATLATANISKEERDGLIKELTENPGKFFKGASDKQERMRTKGSHISAYNSGKKDSGS